jgi:putative transcriptional regulator
MSEMYKFTDGGLRNVWLANGFTVKKTPYGDAVAIEDVPGLTRAICAALTKKPSRLTGVEFRYLRLHLRLSQRTLGQLFGNTEQAVAIWEKTGKIPLLADKHLRLIWVEHDNGNEVIKRVMDRLNIVEQVTESKIILKETRTGWKSQVKYESEAEAQLKVGREIMKKHRGVLRALAKT